MSSSFVIKAPPERYYRENKWIRIQLLNWISFALLVTPGSDQEEEYLYAVGLLGNKEFYLFLDEANIPIAVG